MKKLILTVLLLVPAPTSAHELRPPVAVRSGDVTLEVEQPLHQPELIVRVTDPSARTSEVTCTITERIGSDANNMDLLYTLPVIRHANSRTFVGVYRDEKVMPHGTLIVIEYVSPSAVKRLNATIVMFYH